MHKSRCTLPDISLCPPVSVFAIFINISFSVTYTLTKKNFPLFWLAFLLSLSLVLHLSLCCIFRHGCCLAASSSSSSSSCCCSNLCYCAACCFATCHKLARRKLLHTHTERESETDRHRYIYSHSIREKLLQLYTHICMIYISIQYIYILCRIYIFNTFFLSFDILCCASGHCVVLYHSAVLIYSNYRESNIMCN